MFGRKKQGQKKRKQELVFGIKDENDMEQKVVTCGIESSIIKHEKKLSIRCVKVILILIQIF